MDVKTPKKKKGTAISESTVRFRKSIVADADAWIVDYSFDTEEELWCEVSGEDARFVQVLENFDYLQLYDYFPRKGNEKGM